MEDWTLLLTVEPGALVTQIEVTIFKWIYMKYIR